MAAPRTPPPQTYDQFYASGVPKRDASMRRTKLTGTEERILLWLYWRGDHIAAIARQMGIGKTTVLDRIHELHACPSIIRTKLVWSTSSVISSPAYGRRTSTETRSSSTEPTSAWSERSERGGATTGSTWASAKEP